MRGDEDINSMCPVCGNENIEEEVIRGVVGKTNT